MKNIFVTGTDTGVGKTVITGLWARFLTQKGFNVATQKWVETGSKEGFSHDVDFHLKMMGKDRSASKDYESLSAPYVFSFPASPHLASRLENRRIDINKIISAYKTLSSSFDHVVVEGAGGVLVPFNGKDLLIDLAKKLDLSVLLVVENKLGAINHALLSLEALKKRKIDVIGVIYNNINGCESKISKDNPGIVKKLSGERILGVMPRCKTDSALNKNFSKIAKKIYEQLA
ncbi:MAG TPA: dethiobiotin synthase [Candidatus Omnitrophota bacterium]|nr:dethiobiotin synthase [Candidatus Omnitrophota bacterium]